MINLRSNNEQFLKDGFPPKKTKNKTVAKEMQNNEKTATNNQWISTGLNPYEDKRERRDGPGGEGIED